MQVLAAAAPASAAKAIRNVSFDDSDLGTGAISKWFRLDTPTDFDVEQKTAIIGYNNSSNHSLGADGVSGNTGSVASSESTAAVGSQAAYFVGDVSGNETLAQLTCLSVGSYKVGFSYCQSSNDVANVFNSSLQVQIIGIAVAITATENTSSPGIQYYANSIAQMTQAGHYVTTLAFNSVGSPAEDIVVDRVFAVRPNDAPTAFIPAMLAAVTEPESWAMMIPGLGMVGASVRSKVIVAA